MGALFLVILKLIKKVAEEINKVFFEVIIADGFDKETLRIFKRKKNLRLIDSSNLKNKNLQNFKNDFNMLLLQSSDDIKF